MRRNRTLACGVIWELTSATCRRVQSSMAFCTGTALGAPDGP